MTKYGLCFKMNELGTMLSFSPPLPLTTHFWHKMYSTDWSKPLDPGEVPKADTGAREFYLIRKCFAPNQAAHSG
jgi:hypothetical protein